MISLKPLLWKEWAEIRVFFAVALFVFLGLPLLGGLEEQIQHGRFDMFASIWVYYLGGILAVFVGVGTVVRDLNGRLEDFWRSRPVPLGQWLLVKYFVGLLVVLVTLTLPLVVEEAVNVTKTDMVIPTPVILAWHPFVWAALYSIAFLFACLLRRGAHAAMLALAAALLLYFLPQIIPPLRHLSIEWVTEETRLPRHAHGHLLPIYHPIPWVFGKAVFHAQQLQFAAAMLLTCAAAFAFALTAVRRDWRVESGRKMLYWSVGGALLILFASASFQVATNLTLLQTVDLPHPNEQISEIFSSADRGVVVTLRSIPLGRDRTRTVFSAHPMTITPAGVEIGPAVELPNEYWGRGFWRPETPSFLYAASWHDEFRPPEVTTPRESYPELLVIDLSAPARPAKVLSFKDLTNTDWGGGLLRYFHERLYFISGLHVLTFDLSDPANPRLIDRRPIPPMQHFWAQPVNGEPDVDSFTLFLDHIPDLSPRDRLAVRTADWRAFDGETWSRATPDHVTVYRLDALDADSARFRQTGRYDFTPVQRLFGANAWNLAAAPGYLYESSPVTDGIGSGTRLAVFDLRDPTRPKPAAHFALPHARGALQPHALPDGRILAGGEGHLYLLSPPPIHD